MQVSKEVVVGGAGMIGLGGAWFSGRLLAELRVTWDCIDFFSGNSKFQMFKYFGIPETCSHSVCWLQQTKEKRSKPIKKTPGIKCNEPNDRL